jgi:NDP-sugar pyrophosphorylase family protein
MAHHEKHAHYGYNDFVICLGYKGEMIRDYFLNYETQNRDFTVTLGSGKVVVLGTHTEDGWQVTLAETGGKTMTGGRLKRIEKYIGLSTFMATYGDGVADVNIESLLGFHRREKQVGDSHRGATLLALWRTCHRKWQGDDLPGKASGQRRMDQWRVLCSGT